MSETTIQAMQMMARQLEVQGQQITALASTVGVLLGVLQTKTLLQEVEIEAIFELLSRICPHSEEAQVAEMLAAVKLGAQRSPEFVQLD